MADEFTWAMSEMITRFRVHIGKSSTNELTDEDCAKHINDYYCNYFPEQAQVDLLKGWHTQETSMDDDGDYDLAQTILKLENPVTLNGDRMEFILDSEEFFTDYPRYQDEQFISAPGLAIGSDTTKVLNAAFNYRISGYAYEKASAENTFSGLSTVPQNRYGAFCLKLDEDGTVTIAEADDNSTGYDTAREAVEGLDHADGDSAYMGFVTVISTDSGGFIPGTTALDDSAVIDTYTDGQAQLRSTPEAACIYAGKLWVRPKANDIFQIMAPKLIRPDALETAGAPLDIRWGPAIALGAAILYAREVMKANEVANSLLPTFEHRINSIRAKQIQQRTETTIKRSF